MQAIINCNNAVWFQIEEALTPLPNRSPATAVYGLPKALALLAPAVVTGVAATVCRAASLFQKEKELDPKVDFSEVCKDSRKWAELGKIKPTVGLDDPDFQIGTSVSEYQVSGRKNCPDSQWADWEMVKVAAGNRSGKSVDFYTLIQTKAGRAEIIDRLKKLGVNSFRFSVEWSLLEPKEGKLNSVALNHYKTFCKALKDNKIRPMCTLHHFSEPKWFHAMGSFEKEDNIFYFKRFAETVYKALTASYKKQTLVEDFCTINEPTVEAALRYVMGEFSPGYRLRVERGAIFLKTMIKAHKVVYEALKKIKPTTTIGIVHQPFANIATNIFVFPVVRWSNRFMDEAVRNCFKTGHFELKMPLFCNVQEDIDVKTDVVYLQYYARPVTGIFGSTSFHEPMTLMPWREDPEGLYEAIIDAWSSYKAPVIISENGISTHDEAQRERYLTRALYATQKARERFGKDTVKGYYLWSLVKNFEWALGHDPQDFGAYTTTKKGDKRIMAKEPRPGVAPFVKVAKAWQQAHGNRARR